MRKRIVAVLVVASALALAACGSSGGGGTSSATNGPTTTNADQFSSPSYDKAVSVWCAVDRKKAFTEAKGGAEPKAAKCDNPIAEEFDLGTRLGVNGTPSIYAPNGSQIGGYLTPEQMRAKLDSMAGETKK